MKRWVWEHPDWPDFTLREGALGEAEARFAEGMGHLGQVRPLIGDEPGASLHVEWLVDESMLSSAIEGEYLNRDSVQDSLMRRLGLRPNVRRHAAREEGIAAMMTELYTNYARPLTHDDLFAWHLELMSGNPYIVALGDYRRGDGPMLIVSGHQGGERVVYEAPPTKNVRQEMDRYIDWFNHRTEGGSDALAVAAEAHLRFESIHPFEDGNGRIGRALIEKALARMFGQPTLQPLAVQIAKDRKGYYAALKSVQGAHSMSMDPWAAWFADVALKAQERCEKSIVAVVAKARILDRLGGRLNSRQNKAVGRLFDAEPEGFKGGLSAGSYQTITGATAPTTTRDLAALVEMGVLKRTGERRHTRYWLDLPTLAQFRDGWLERAGT